MLIYTNENIVLPDVLCYAPLYTPTFVTVHCSRSINSQNLKSIFESCEHVNLNRIQIQMY